MSQAHVPSVSAIRSARRSRRCSRGEVHDPGHRVPDDHPRQGHAPTCSTRASTTRRSATRRRGASRRGRSSGRRRSCAASSAGRLRLRRAPEAGVLLRRERSSSSDRIERILQEIQAERAAPQARSRRRGLTPAAPDADAHDDRAGPRLARPPSRRDGHRRPDPRRDPPAAALPADLPRAARRRLDRLAAGDGVRARGARQAGPARQRRRRAGALPRVPRRGPHRDRRRDDRTRRRTR